MPVFRRDGTARYAMTREVAAGFAGFSAEYVRFQTGRNESLYDVDRKGSLQSVTCERAVHRVTVPE